MKAILPLLLISAASLAAFYMTQAPQFHSQSLELENQFLNFIAEHQKSYKDQAEVSARFEIYKKNVGEINRLMRSGELSHEIGVNYMADWTHEEYQRLMGYKSRRTEDPVDTYSPSGLKQIFNYKDWQELGFVNPIKDQGSCGSCWAFSAIAPVESDFAISNKTPGDIIDLSEQELVDCSHELGSDGCNGGWMDGAMEYMSKKRVILTSEYPYRAIDQDCVKTKVDDNKSATKIKKIKEFVQLDYNSKGE